jgi:transcriptional regulator with XRE-family HTH domain
MADYILGGRLVEQLRLLRSERGLSYERIAQELGRENVAATGTTVNAWCDQLGIEKSSGSTAGAA